MKEIATILDYARFMRRCCNNTDKPCSKCSLSNKSNSLTCIDYITEHPYEASEIILKWCKENPIKTYRNDFLERFPDAPMDEDGIPWACRYHIYGRDGLCDGACHHCWNEDFE